MYEFNSNGLSRFHARQERFLLDHGINLAPSPQAIPMHLLISSWPQFIHQYSFLSALQLLDEANAVIRPNTEKVQLSNPRFSP
jgi:hypothetical protein